MGIPLYPFGHVAVLGFVALVAQAIRRHRLVDITPAFDAKEIINAMDDALLVLEDEGIVRVANGAACRMFSRSEKELEGMPVGVLANFFTFPGGDLVRLFSRVHCAIAKVFCKLDARG